MFVSPPVADIFGFVPVAAFVAVISFTAEAVAGVFIISFPLVSFILVPTFGEVRVLLVKVCVADLPTAVSLPVISAKMIFILLIWLFEIGKTIVAPFRCVFAAYPSCPLVTP